MQHVGKKTISKSNISSLNYDLSPLESTDVIGGSPAPANAAGKNASPSASATGTADSSRRGSKDNSPGSSMPSQQHMQHGHGTPGAQNQNPNIAHAQVKHGYGTAAHGEWVDSPYAGDYSLPHAAQQRHVALQLLATQTQHAGYSAPKSVYNNLGEYNRSAGYGLSSVPQQGQHPIT